MSPTYTKDGIRRIRESGSVQANKVRALLDNTDFSHRRSAMAFKGYRVYVHDKMVDGAMYVDHGRTLVVVARDTWFSLTHVELAQLQLVQMAMDGASGMRFLPMDTGPFAESLRIEAAGMDIGKSEADMVSDIEARAQALLVAAGNHTGTDVLQTQLLMRDYNRLIEDADALTVRLAKVRSLVETAGETAFGA